MVAKRFLSRLTYTRSWLCKLCSASSTDSPFFPDAAGHLLALHLPGVIGDGFPLVKLTDPLFVASCG